jgi:cation transport protein ChaC
MVAAKLNAVLDMSDSVTIVERSNPVRPAGRCGDFWVFGYGSLMWNPGFSFVERVPALLHGSHRAFCVFSTRYRGTKEVPGVVLGLDRGGCCRGFAFRIASEKADEVYHYLHAREMINGVYREVMHRLRLADGRKIDALSYIVRREHRSYTGKLERDALLSLIRQGQGNAGTCSDYVLNTLQTLEAHGIHDHALAWLKPALRQPPLPLLSDD